MLPPGGKDTMKVIGPVGNSCPRPRPPSAKRPASTGASRMARRVIMSSVPCDAGTRTLQHRMRSCDVAGTAAICLSARSAEQLYPPGPELVDPADDVDFLVVNK